MSRPPLVLIPQHFGALLFDRHTSRYLPFDRESAGVLASLVEHGADELIDAEPCDRRELVEGFVSSLFERGYLRMDGRLAAAVIDREVPPEHLLGPLAVHLEVIAACNLRCAHCFAG